MDHEEYTKLKQEIEDKYRRDMQALERIWNLSQKMSSFEERFNKFAQDIDERFKKVSCKLEHLEKRT